MKFSDFKQISLEVWSQYFEQISYLSFTSIDSRKFHTLFPNMALFTETDGHFLIDFLGFDKYRKNIRAITNRKLHSTDAYVYQFSDEAPDESKKFIRLDSSTLTGGTIRGALNDQSIKERIPFLDMMKRTQIISKGQKSGELISFGECLKPGIISNSLIVNRHENIHRIKYVLCLMVVKKTVKPKKFRQNLRKRLQDNLQTLRAGSADLPLGVSICKQKQGNIYLTASQFMSAFLFPGIRETSISQFLVKNPTILTEAFGCESFIPEPDLLWVEGNPEPSEKSIKPDFMLKLQDGSFDICDIKRSELESSSITTGKHKRRRFISKVNDGIAQLANYKEYFDYPGNRKYAREKYGISVSNPKLFLVVGNYENAKQEEIREASRMLSSNIHVIDYDTLTTMFIQKVR